MRIGITGASGYIGRRLVTVAQGHGHEVVSIGRRAVPGVREHRPADLGSLPAAGLVDGLDAVIHLAADTAATADAAAEIAFATSLAAQCGQSGVRLLVASSQAASTTAPSRYGRTKAAIEEQVLASGAVVVRPGLVYGGSPSGLFGMLVSMLRALPVIPDLRPPPPVQPIHVDDLATAMLRAVGDAFVPARVWKVSGTALPFGDFLDLIVRHRLRRSRWRVPVPVPGLRWLLHLGASVAGPRLSPERLDSLTRLVAMDSAGDLAALGVVARPLAQGLALGDADRRALLVEGQTLMAAVAGRRPGRFASRRYVLALQALGFEHALPWPRAMLAWPALVAALDAPSGRADARPGGRAWRYGAALRVLETRPGAVGLFIPLPGRAGLGRVAVDFLRAAGLEVGMRLLGPVARSIAGRLA